MKIFAGWKFHGRKPTHTPAVTAASSAASEASPNGLGERVIYRKNAPAAIATIPAARPSSPSTRFTAFTNATTHRIVISTLMSEPSSTKIPSPGNQK